MRHLLLFLPVLAALMLLPSTEAAPPTLSVDSGQGIIQVALAVPTQVDLVSVDVVADAQPQGFVDTLVETTTDGASAVGVLLRDLYGARQASTSDNFYFHLGQSSVLTLYRENRPDGTTRLRC